MDIFYAENRQKPKITTIKDEDSLTDIDVLSLLDKLLIEEQELGEMEDDSSDRIDNLKRRFVPTIPTDDTTNMYAFVYWFFYVHYFLSSWHSVSAEPTVKQKTVDKRVTFSSDVIEQNPDDDASDILVRNQVNDYWLSETI